MSLQRLDKNSPDIGPNKLVIFNSCTQFVNGEFDTFKNNTQITHFVVERIRRKDSTEASPLYTYKIEPVEIDPSYFKGHEILGMACGFNNTVDQMSATWFAMASLVSKAGKVYQRFVCFMWAGCEKRVEYPMARSNAYWAGQLFAKKLTYMFNEAKEIDYLAHSMGCRMISNLLSNLDDYWLNSTNKLCVNDHVTFLSPAIDTDAFEPEGEFSKVPRKCAQVTVFYTHNDLLLRFGYTGMEFLSTLPFLFEWKIPGKESMGFQGVHNLNNAPDNVVTIDVTEFTNGHNDYWTKHKEYLYLAYRDTKEEIGSNRDLKMLSNGDTEAKRPANLVKPLYVTTVIAYNIGNYLKSFLWPTSQVVTPVRRS